MEIPGHPSKVMSSKEQSQLSQEYRKQRFTQQNLQPDPRHHQLEGVSSEHFHLSLGLPGPAPGHSAITAALGGNQLLAPRYTAPKPV